MSRDICASGGCQWVRRACFLVAKLFDFCYQSDEWKACQVILRRRWMWCCCCDMHFRSLRWELLEASRTIWAMWLVFRMSIGSVLTGPRCSVGLIQSSALYNFNVPGSPVCCHSPPANDHVNCWLSQTMSIWQDTQTGCDCDICGSAAGRCRWWLSYAFLTWLSFARDQQMARSALKVGIAITGDTICHNNIIAGPQWALNRLVRDPIAPHKSSASVSLPHWSEDETSALKIHAHCSSCYSFPLYSFFPYSSGWGDKRFLQLDWHSFLRKIGALYSNRIVYCSTVYCTNSWVLSIASFLYHAIPWQSWLMSD